MNGDIGYHAFGNKLLLNVLADHFVAGLKRKLSGKSDMQLPRHLRVPVGFRFLDSVPESIAVSVLSRCVVGQHDLRVDHAALVVVILGPVGAFIVETLAGLVGRRSCGRR